MAIGSNDKPKAVLAFKIASKSTPGKFYEAIVYDTGDTECRELDKEGKLKKDGCVASEMHKFCRHQRKAYIRLKRLVEAIEAVQIGKIKPKEKTD